MTGITRRVILRGSSCEVGIGGGEPIRVQTMLNKLPEDTKGNLEQAKRCVDAGAEIIRYSVPNEDALPTLERLIKEIPVPIVADIHFNGEMAIESAKRGVAKLRINPGNIGGFDKTIPVVEAAKANGCAIRVGVNAGSLDKEISENPNLTFPEKLCASATQYADFLEKDCNFKNYVVSIKAHDVNTSVEANKAFSKARPDVPLHIGITEAGTQFQGLIKSSAGLALMLTQGIGDTIRVSLTDDPETEVRAGWGILSAIGLRRRGVELISCPTCARTQVDVIGIAKQIEEALQNETKPIKVAVMGCVVNGPGEAADANVGVACGKGSAVLFSHGNIIKKVTEAEIVDTLLEEIQKL